MKTYNVNYLLAMSRLPDHFHAALHGHTGRDELYQNPGVSLRSFVIARCIRQEFVEVPEEMLATVEECEKFSHSTQVLSHIVESLQKSTEYLLLLIESLPSASIGDFLSFMTPLSEFSQVMKLSFDAFIMNQDPATDHVDIESAHGVKLKSAMIDLLMLIEDVSSNLPRKA